MTNPNNICHLITAHHQAAVELYNTKGINCTVVAQRLGLPISILARLVSQSFVDRSDFWPSEQVYHISGGTVGKDDAPTAIRRPLPT
jgi:hypothetical protein